MLFQLKLFIPILSFHIYSTAMLSNSQNVVLLTLLWSLLSTFVVVSKATLTDITCLQSIKDSVADPHGYLNTSWNFNDNTEGFICYFVGVECWHADENKVMAIRLSGMGLKGEFPQGLKHCTSLVSLTLSFNEFYGPIPSNVSQIIKYVTDLDLSYNNFSGEIPVSIANCTFLNFLKLNNNQLAGYIPSEIGLLGRIRNFSVANNSLVGPVPNFFGFNFTRDSYANNPGLCGGPLEPCEEPTREFKLSFVRGYVTGYAVSFVSIVVFIVSNCIPWLHAKSMNKMITVAKMAMLMTRKNGDNADKIRGPASMELIPEESKEISTMEQMGITRVSYADLSDATSNFSEDNVIGLGEIGIMYKATLPNGYLLAVKKLYDSQFLEEIFVSELKTLGALKHVNLLPFLGFCIRSNERLLVYKYMPNGNLYDWLHPLKGEAKIMEWPKRVKIAIGLSRVLSWLHQECNIRVIHLNISLKCILLDQNFEPKLSNFGEAMLIGPNDTSELWEMAFIKEDVYSFGVILFELITGVDSSKMTTSLNSNGGIRNEWVSHLFHSSPDFYDVVDKSLLGKGFDVEIFHFLNIACNCVHSVPEQRPTMLQVYKDIKVIGERYGLAEDSKTQTTSNASSEDESVDIEIVQMQ